MNMYTVIVTFGSEEPIVHNKEYYEAAHIVFVNECGNAARVSATKPVGPVIIELWVPKTTVTGEETRSMEKSMLIDATKY